MIDAQIAASPVERSDESVLILTVFETSNLEEEKSVILPKKKHSSPKWEQNDME
jgi:hypothetical protein